MEASVQQPFLDQETCVHFLEVPAASVVLLQALFESYEGVGVVRTLDTERSIVCILSTPTTYVECGRILDSVREQIGYRVLTELPEAQARVLAGDFRS